MSDDQPNKRSWKNYLIRKDVQLPIIATNLVFLIIVAAVFLSVLLVPLYQDMLGADDPVVQQVAGRVFLVLLQRIVSAMLLIMILAAAHQLILSHRFCGPLINFAHTFEKMARGDFTRKVRLRRRDFLKPEADRVNAVLDRLNTDGRRLDEAMQQMAALVDQLNMQPNGGTSTEMIERLAEPVDACRNILSSWTIRPND